MIVEEQPRMFVVQSIAKARAQTFEGPAYRPWEWPGHHSLPPPPDPPKKAYGHNDDRPARKPVDNPNMVCVTTVEGKRKWTLSPQLVEEVQRRVQEGERTKAIASALNLPVSTINRVRTAMRKETVAKPVAQERCQEPQRTFVIDWKSRLAAVEYSVPPTGCLPRKGRKCVSSMTRGQLAEALRSHGVLVPLAINCAAPGQQPCAITGKPVKPRKTQYANKKFVGEKGFDVEELWRETCAT